MTHRRAGAVGMAEEEGPRRRPTKMQKAKNQRRFTLCLSRTSAGRIRRRTRASCPVPFPPPAASGCGRLCEVRRAIKDRVQQHRLPARRRCTASTTPTSSRWPPRAGAVLLEVSARLHARLCTNNNFVMLTLPPLPNYAPCTPAANGGWYTIGRPLDEVESVPLLNGTITGSLPSHPPPHLIS